MAAGREKGEESKKLNMSRYIDPKCRLCRRAGEKLFLKGDRCFTPKCAITRRNYAPGQHGSKGKGRPSEFALHLAEKQKLRRIYGLNERQFANIFVRSSKKSGVVGHNFLIGLEMRLDSVVYRLKLAKSRNQARQLVNHGHFLVNDQKVDIPAYILEPGDTVKINPFSLRKAFFKDLLKETAKTEAGWLEFNSRKAEAKILNQPDITKLDYTVDIAKVVEFYSR